ncbi:MAG TPA: SDR family NAD(P)-dependent oxidoreductase, partial [Pseudonocardia sp.]|nr:SDR family NAD(P)-dependent oxidoreductase [Pseudonocardia sp.]
MQNEDRLREYLKRVTSELRTTRRELEAERGRRVEPLAIVGMACRFPGGIDTPDGLWQALREGRDLVGPFPTDRGWDLEHLFDSDPDRVRTSYVREGAFLEGVTGFDAGFFEVSPREALAMDPQQRMLLETTWESLESAGIDPHTLPGRAIGVFVGISDQGYIAAAEAAVGAEVEGHILTGNGAAVASGRLAYVFGLEGPTVTVDTMCSSSLVALHLAAQAIRTGECEAALVGGATVMAGPRNFVEFSRLRGLASDGRCKPFAAAADGTGWGEAVATVFLEPLSTARREGHPVLAVLRGSAINSDGASNGLTAPNGPSQQRVIRSALKRSGLEPSDVDVVEAHGTGTELGDPIEAQALLATYGQDRDHPLWLGALKSATGHTQAASGLAGVIKMVLALRHRHLPATLHFDAPTPLVDWEAGMVEPIAVARDWPATGRPRRAGISSFGGSGTNAHVVIEEAPEPAEDAAAPDAAAPDSAAPDSAAQDSAAQDSAAREAGPAGGDPELAPALSGPRAPLAWPLSARSEGALSAVAAGLAGVLGSANSANSAGTAEVAAALAARSVFEHRAVVVDPGADSGATDPSEFHGGRCLDALGRGLTVAGTVRGRAVSESGSPVFVFPGQGAQWVGMARDLLDGGGRSAELFAERLRECSAAVVAVGGPDVVAVLGDDDPAALDDVAVVQPASWAVMVALAAVWLDAGVVPAAVVGHSQGEIAAAVVAGALSVADGAKVVVSRAMALRQVAGSGTMASLAETPDAAAARIADVDGVEIAAVNGPCSVVVAGPVAGVEAVVAAAEADGLRAKRIPVDYASHTPGMEPLRAAVTGALSDIAPVAPTIPWLSTRDLDWVDDDRTDAEYWFANLRHTVRFAEAIASLLATGFDAFIEVSPHPVLVPMLVEAADAAGVSIAASGTLRRGEGGPARLCTALAEAWTGGVAIEWSRFVEGVDPRAVPLPTYPFQRGTFWLAAPPVPGSTAGNGQDPVDAAFWAAVRDGDVGALLGNLPGEQGPHGHDVLTEALPLLAGWRGRHDDEQTKRDWRYRIAWEPHPDTSVSATGTWLLIHSTATPGDDPLVTRVREALEPTGTVVVAALDPATGRAKAAEQVRAVADGHPDLAGVLSLLAADEADHPGHPGLPTGLVGTLTLLQGLGDAGVAARLWAVTEGAEAIAGEQPVRPVQAAVWGLGRVAALELPESWGGLIDLPGAPPAGPTEDAEPAGDPARLLPTVLANLDEDQVALRPAGAMVRRLRRAPDGVARSKTGVGRVTRGTALITGGTGGLGGHTARLLARTGTEHLVLISRRGPDAEGTVALRAELEALGARVTIATCDVTDAAAVTALVERIEAEGDVVRSVMHTAGYGVLAPIMETTPDQFADGALAKLAGTRVLDGIFDGDRGRALDSFVVFSSVAGLWGSGDHGSYSASNAMADAMAGNRRARGLVGTSIAWGIWETAGGGMSLNVVTTQLKWRGIRFMAAALAIDALVDALDADETLLVVADIDWEIFAPVFTAARRRPLLDGVPEVVEVLARADGGAVTASGTSEELGAALRARMAAATDPGRVLLDAVREAVAAALGFDDSAKVEDDRAFREMGVDSLTAVALRNGVVAVTGQRLPVTVVFDHPTVTALTRHLREEMGLGAPASAELVAAPTDAADSTDDPVVVVGMACRLPGEIRTPEQLWRVLHEGTDVVSGFPTDRGWDLDALYDADPDRERTVYTRHGGFLHDAAEFDPEFFGISPREALAMDPQQRLLLETSWEALERAGIDPRAATDVRTGVFVGAAYQGFGSVGELPDGLEGHLVTGTVTSVASGRIAYALGLEGPAVTIDSACSSSLVALHQACQALRAGDCDRALVGGVAVMAAPTGLLGFARQRGLAVDGRCKAFSADADGMGLGEGAGMLTVERLSTARAAGHPVLAVIRASAINQDGASNGLSAPSGPAQQRVIRAALRRAGLTTDDIDAVEAHGTGTSLGDPIEAQALLATYGRDRDEDRPLWLGSVKSNLGHTQAAAGAVGLIKMMLAMRHEELPATLHAANASPHVDWEAGAVRLLTEPRPWVTNGRPRRAAVSSFGVSGTNAHVIIEEPPSAPAPTATPVEAGIVPWVVSARTAAALDDAVAGLAALPGASDGGPEPGTVAAVLAGRTEFEHRRVLDAATGEPLACGRATSRAAGPVFVFPGQGAQWVGMAAALLGAADGAGPEAAFARRFAECADALAAVSEMGAVDARAALLDTRDGSLDDVGVLQPVSWAVMVALAAMWESVGVVPSAVVGHSQGEIAAAV